MSLKSFEKNIQSQFGEDGVIEEVFNRIGDKNKICVEFGAWDGIHLSNTWNLWHNKRWASLLIEGDPEKFQLLVKNTGEFDNVTALNLYVSFEGESSLDKIFEKQKLPLDIDCLSIDIDSDDFYIFESLKNYRPRLIIIEYNPTIPPYLDIVQKKGEYFGCSALALLNLARQKNYVLAHMTDTNMFFVTGEEFEKLNIVEPELNMIFPIQYLTNVITSYDGRALLSHQPTYMPDIVKSKSGLFKKKNAKRLELVSGYDLIPVTIKKN